MSKLPHCPQCNSEYTYEDGIMLVCPECAHEWSQDAADSNDDEIAGIGAMKLKSEFVKKA